jgi:hypothetical protein
MQKLREVMGDDKKETNGSVTLDGKNITQEQLQEALDSPGKKIIEKSKNEYKTLEKLR